MVRTKRTAIRSRSLQVRGELEPRVVTDGCGVIFMTNELHEKNQIHGAALARFQQRDTLAISDTELPLNPPKRRAKTIITVGTKATGFKRIATFNARPKDLSPVRVSKSPTPTSPPKTRTRTSARVAQTQRRAIKTVDVDADGEFEFEDEIDPINYLDQNVWGAFTPESSSIKATKTVTARRSTASLSAGPLQKPRGLIMKKPVKNSPVKTRFSARTSKGQSDSPALVNSPATSALQTKQTAIAKSPTQGSESELNKASAGFQDKVAMAESDESDYQALPAESRKSLDSQTKARPTLRLSFKSVGEKVPGTTPLRRSTRIHAPIKSFTPINGKAQDTEPMPQAILEDDEEDLPMLDIHEGDDNDSDFDGPEAGEIEDDDSDFEPDSARPSKRARVSAAQPVSLITTNVATQGSTVTQAPLASAPPASTAVPAQAAISTNNAPATTSTNFPGIATASGAPANALTPHEHFMVGHPRPMGVLLPTNHAQTAFQYRAYTTRVVDFNDEEDVRLINRWKQQVVRRVQKKLGIVEDGRSLRTH